MAEKSKAYACPTWPPVMGEVLLMASWVALGTVAWMVLWMISHCQLHRLSPLRPTSIRLSTGSLSTPTWYSPRL